MICGVYERTCWIPHPLLREKSDRVALRYSRGYLNFLAGDGRIQGRGKIMPCTQTEVSDLGCSRVYLDKKRCSRLLLQNEIEPVQARKAEPANEFFCRC